MVTLYFLNIVSKQVPYFFDQLIICCYFSLQQKLIQDNLKSQKAEEANIQEEIDDYDKELKLFATKKNTVMTRIEEYNESIYKLGPLPLQEKTKYRNMGTKQVSMLSCIEIKVIDNSPAYSQQFHLLVVQAEIL
jgi:uncharacterized protein YlxW (UPF0749 family)